MNATPLVPESHNARNLGDEKKLVDRFLVVWYDPEAAEMTPIVDARIYMGRTNTASVVRCSIWIGEHATWSGYGSAGSYGYHKASAALEQAIKSAGWQLDTDIHGGSPGAMRDALRAIARSLKGPSAVLEVLR